MISARRSAALLVAATALLTTHLAAAAPASAVAGYPSVAITSPVDASTVAGAVAVSVTGSLDPLGAAVATTMTLSVDGSPASSLPCAVPATTDCAVTFSWDASTLTGTHTLQAGMADSLGGTTASAVVTVTVSRTSAFLAVTSPHAGSAVARQRTVDVVATGGIPADSSATVAGIALYLDGHYKTVFSCVGQPDDHTCTATFPWTTTGLAGGHVLSTVLTDSTGATVASAPVRVFVRTVPKVEITVPTVRTGTTATARVVVRAEDGRTIPGVALTVTFTPPHLIGPPRVYHVTTARTGGIQWKVPVRTTSTVKATIDAPGPWWSVWTGHGLSEAIPHYSCAWTHTARLSGYATVTCSEPYIPKGIWSALQVQQRSTWRRIGQTSSVPHSWTYHVRSTTRSTYYVRMLLSNSPYWASLFTAPMRITFT